ESNCDRAGGRSVDMPEAAPPAPRLPRRRRCAARRAQPDRPADRTRPGVPRTRGAWRRLPPASPSPARPSRLAESELTPALGPVVRAEGARPPRTPARRREVVDGSKLGRETRRVYARGEKRG